MSCFAVLSVVACGEAVECRGSNSTTPWQAVEYETFFGYPAWMPYQFVSDGEQLLVLESSCVPDCGYWELDPQEATWTSIATGLPTTADLANIAASTQSVVSLSEQGILLTVRDDGKQVELSYPDGFRARDFTQSVVWTGSAYIAWGGREIEYGLVEPGQEVLGLSDGLVVDPASRSLRVIPPFRPPEALDGWPPVAEWTGTHLLAVHPDWVALYDPKTNEWEELGGSRRPPVGGPPGLILIGDVLYAFKDRELYRTGPEVKQWERIEVPNFVSFGRTVASRGRLVTFGADCPGPTMYDPRTQEWTVLSSNGAPWSLEGERFAFGDHIGAVGLYVDHVNQFPALLMLEVPR